MISKKTIFLAIIILILFPFSIFSFAISKEMDLNLYPNVKAADVTDVDLSELPQIDYSWGAEWEDPKIEMLIIVPANKPAWVEAVKPLAAWKNEKGVKTIILNDTSGFSGIDKAEEIRNMIKYYYERENIKWVLLCGDAQADLIPIRKVYNPDISGEAFLDKPTDYYYADLTGSWDSDGDGVFGEAARFAGGIDEIEWTPDVYVGRLPANNLYELELLVNKTLKYESDPFIGQWMNRMLLAGGISEPTPTESGYEDEGRLTQYIWQQYIPSAMNFTHLVDYTGKYYASQFIPDDPFVDLTQARVSQNMTAGYSTVIMAGHGDNNNFYSKLSPIQTTGYSSNDAKSIGNTNMPSLVYIDACETTSYDKNDGNLGETLINATHAGAIGVIGALRITFYYTNDAKLEKLNRGNAKLFWYEFFVEKKFQQGKALYDSKVAYINSDYYQNRVNPTYEEEERKNLLTYCLLGDPEVDIYTDIPSKASNPFTGNIFEGQLITNTVRDINGEVVPYARIYLKSEDGKYNYTTYANKFGRLNFRIYPKENVNYNVTITGHNLIPSHFNFTTLPDFIKPEFDDEECSPENPTVSDNVCFDIEAYDFQSGLESVFLLQSEDNDFDEYEYYEMLNRFQGDSNTFSYELKKLEPGEYFFLIIGRDWANNYKILEDESFEIVIPTPLMDYLLIIMSIAVVGVVGISITIAYITFKNYKHAFWKLKRESSH
ncbi:MAG: C25 family cysteine peptidase [Candidatus Hodarchaeota archaeon]